MSTRKVHAVCTLDCPDSCGVLVTVDQLTGRAVKVQGDPAHPVTRGFLCGKVARYLDHVYSPERLLYPMRRRPGVPKGPLPKGRELEAFERVSWDEALTHVATRLKAIAEEYGPESILPYSYAGTIGQLGYGSMDRRFFHRLGASQLDRTICASAGSAAMNAVYGTRLGTAPQDFVHAGLIIAWGANIHGNSIHLWPFIEEARRGGPGKRGARLVVIDPYRTRTAALADEHLAIRPGTDALLALALLHVLFRDGYADLDYLRDCTHGWEALRDHALQPEHAPARAAETTGIAADTIERLAAQYGRAGHEGSRGPAVIRVNYGIQRSENGGTAARTVAMLPLVTGSWKQQGGGLLLSTSGAFAFNAAKLQMPELMQQSALGRAARTINMNQLGWALTELGEASKADATSDGESVLQAGPPVKALFVYNCNPAAVSPDSMQVLTGLRRNDLFTVVHEQSFTDTTDYADVLLPATTFLEHKELMGAYGHYIAQLSEPAIAPLGEARTNVWVFAELGRRMGFEEPAFSDEDDELIAQALSSGHPYLAGVTPERLQRDKQVPLALPCNSDGHVLPFSDASWFRTLHGKAELLPVPEFVPAHESRAAQTADPRFPLQFLPRKADSYMNSTFANLPRHRQMERHTEGLLEIHEGDAKVRGIADGDEVSIWNDRGRIHLRALVGVEGDGRVSRGVVAARLDWHKLARGRMNVNALTSQRLTDLGGGATFYSTMVEIERVRSPTTPAEPMLA